MYRRLLGKAALVFDIGAYDGHKTAAFLEISHRVVACEPDPFSFRTLRIRFRARQKRVLLYSVAVTDRMGTGRLFIHHPGSAFNTLDPRWAEVLEADGRRRWNEDLSFGGDEVKVVTTTLDELIRVHGIPEFVKIDAEGSERKVMAGLSQRVPCISWECLLPEFRDDLMHILDKLMALDRGTIFNVIHEEELIFSDFVGYEQLLHWLDGKPPFSFDIVART